MKKAAFLLALTLAAPAFAYDDEMMGTMVNGRIESRNERSARVQDPEMDREEMIIDREKRQGRNTVDPDKQVSGERQPYEGPLPD